ncbi:MAG: hypothetical protein RR219_09435 [Clostridiales bacterium]
MTKKNIVIFILLIIGIIIGSVSMILNHQKEKENTKGEEEAGLYQNGEEVFFDTDETTDEWDYIGGDTIPSKDTKVEPKEDMEAEIPEQKYNPGEIKDIPKQDGEEDVFSGQGDAGIPDESIPDAGMTE